MLSIVIGNFEIHSLSIQKRFACANKFLVEKLNVSKLACRRGNALISGCIIYPVLSQNTT